MKDEQIYEDVAQELASSPRQGLLIKCMAKCGGDENKGKAMYVQVRVDEIKARIKRKQAEGILKKYNIPTVVGTCLGLAIAILILRYMTEFWLG